MSVILCPGLWITHLRVLKTYGNMQTASQFLHCKLTQIGIRSYSRCMNLILRWRQKLHVSSNPQNKFSSWKHVWFRVLHAKFFQNHDLVSSLYNHQPLVFWYSEDVPGSTSTPSRFPAFNLRRNLKIWTFNENPPKLLKGHKHKILNAKDQRIPKRLQQQTRAHMILPRWRFYRARWNVFLSNSWWYTGAVGWRPRMLPSTCRTACCLGTFAKFRWTWGSDPTNQASCSFNHSRGGLRHAPGTWVVLGHKAMLKSALARRTFILKQSSVEGKRDAPRMGGAATLWCCDAARGRWRCDAATLWRCWRSVAATVRRCDAVVCPMTLPLRRCGCPSGPTLRRCWHCDGAMLPSRTDAAMLLALRPMMLRLARWKTQGLTLRPP